jgi:hypothetical protein
VDSVNKQLYAKKTKELVREFFARAFNEAEKHEVVIQMRVNNITVTVQPGVLTYRHVDEN